jgi:GTP-binding protein HflX
VTLPYDRGDLVARIHRKGQVVATRHTDEGTELTVRVDQQLAAELAPFTS